MRWYSGGSNVNGSLSLGNLPISSLGSLGALNLVGGTLTLSPQGSTLTPGLVGSYFNTPTANNNTTSTDYTGGSGPANPQTVSTINFPSITNVNASSILPGGIGTIVGANVEQFGVQWVGKIFIANAGPTQFFLQSYAGSRLYIDGVLVVNNDGAHNNTFQKLGGTVDLSAGYHDIRVEYGAGAAGTAGIVMSWIPFGTTGSDVVVPSSVLFTSDTAAGNAVNVSGNSTIQVAGGAFTTLGLGALTANAGSTLNVVGLPGKKLTFTSTTLNGTGAIYVNDAPDVDLGPVTGTAAVNLAKQGTGQLFLGNSSASTPNSLAAGSTLDIYGGKVVAVGYGGAGATNPLSTAAITLDGGTLSLDTLFNTPAAVFDNPVIVAQSSTIEAQPGAGVTMTLGSAANGIIILPNQTLTLNAFAGDVGASGALFGVAGAALTVAGVIGGSGNLAVAGTATGSILALRRAA